MDLLKYKVLVRNLFEIRIKNLFFLLKIRGKRNSKSIIIPHGKCYIGYKNSSEINVNHGIFFLNRNMTKPEPYTAVLKMLSNAKINVNETFSIYSGHHIVVMENAKLNLGSGYINRNVRIHCFKEISIGNGVAISENVTIWDTDSHVINGKKEQMTQPVKIGNKVWIGNNVTILKGVTIGDGAIIAAGSLVNKNIPERCLAAGVPAKVIKENVSWE